MRGHGGRGPGLGEGQEASGGGRLLAAWKIERKRHGRPWGVGWGERAMRKGVAGVSRGLGRTHGKEVML